MATFAIEDQFMATLMAYKEAANQGDTGITAVLCVARNNAYKHKTSIFSEVTKAFRYSSINCPVSVAKYCEESKLTDLQQIVNALSKYPSQANTSDWNVWKHIQNIVIGVLSDVTADITNGATLYYSTAMLKECPFDQSKIVFTTQIGAQRFYREL